MELTLTRETPRVREALGVLAEELRRHHRATAEHSHRLAGMARRVADHMGLDPLAATEVELVAVVHDVGKLAVTRDILDHTGPLDSFQRDLMKRHTIAGEEILVRTAGLEHLGGLVRATHEWWNGEGYPDGLAGEAIPIEARIVGCVDAFDAMTSDRSYRRAMSYQAACRRIAAAAGRQFDPSVAAALIDMVVEDF
jgi:HD-GYP domain-containing protein (c-di-GMP phosphodiesterase class II)